MYVKDCNDVSSTFCCSTLLVQTYEENGSYCQQMNGITRTKSILKCNGTLWFR